MMFEDCIAAPSACYTHYIKPYQELRFVDDFMFTMVMTDDEEICKGVVSLATGRKVDRIVMSTRQLTIDRLKNGRGVRFDVFFADDKNRVYDIEMQTTHDPHIAKRTRYYQGMIDNECLRRHQNYGYLPESYVVFLCMKDPFHQKMPVYTFENKCREKPELLLNDGTYKIFLNAETFGNGAKDDMHSFLYYLKVGLPTDPLTEKIHDKVEELRQDQKGEGLYMTLQERDERNRKEGEAVGFAEGKADGVQSMSELIQQLIQNGRQADIERVASDSDYRDQLLKEYGLQ